MAASHLPFFSSVPKPNRSLISRLNHSNPPSVPPLWHFRKISTARASIAAQPAVKSPDDLVAAILSKLINYGPLRLHLAGGKMGGDNMVKGSDGGVLLTKEGHQEVANVARQLSKYCVDKPVKCPLIFGEWDVVYCSRPTSPGGGYRSAFGRLIFKANEMMQAVEAPDTVRNKVSFSVFGFLDGEVSLKGKLKILDDKWIQVIFEPPELKIGSLGFQYGGQSEVQLEITYIDEKIRLGKGSRGSLFVFLRR